jgi:hypothetical protein
MRIPPDASVAVVISNDWANSEGVKSFIHAESSVIRGDTRILLGKILDQTGVGLWVEQLRRKDDKKKPNTVLIPWSQIITIAIGPGAEEQRKVALGFKPDNER